MFDQRRLQTRSAKTNQTAKRQKGQKVRQTLSSKNKAMLKHHTSSRIWLPILLTV